MTVPTELDRRFRDAAAAEGLLDVAYELHDTPVGRFIASRNSPAMNGFFSLAMLMSLGHVPGQAPSSAPPTR